MKYRIDECHGHYKIFINWPNSICDDNKWIRIEMNGKFMIDMGFKLSQFYDLLVNWGAWERESSTYIDYVWDSRRDAEIFMKYLESLYIMKKLEK